MLRTWLVVGLVSGALLIGGLTWYFVFNAEDGSRVSDIRASTTVPAKSSAAKQSDKNAKTPVAGPGWAMNCKSGAQDKGLVCRLTQTVILKDTGQVLTRVTLVVPQNSQQPELQVQVPLGVYLPAGAALQVDQNKPQSLQFKACGRRGCYAETSLSADFFAQLRKGKQLVLAFKNANQKTITLPLSLDQLDEAYSRAQNV